METESNSFVNAVRLIGIALLGVVMAGALVATLVIAKDFIMLIFLGVLFGVFLTKTAGLTSQFVSIGYAWSLAIVTLLLLSISIGGVVILGAKVEHRLNGMSLKLDEASEKLESWLGEHPVAMRLFQRIPFAKEILNDQNSPQNDGWKSSTVNDQESPSGRLETNGSSARNGDQADSEENSISSVSSPNSKPAGTSSPGAAGPGPRGGTSNQNGEIASLPTTALRSVAGRTIEVFQNMIGTTLGLVANLGMIFFVGLFLAIDPPLYRDGFARLFPNGRRERLTCVMDQMSDSMFAWLNGRFISMLLTGVGTAIALWALEVPMPFAIGMITGQLTFIPNIGGIIALGLAMLMALTQGPMTVVWVVVIYAALQLVESNLITPIIQQQQTSIPPALLLSFQVILGALTGFLGLLVATPLLAAALVGVQEWWVKDVIGDDLA